MKTLLLSADIENLSLASKLLRDGEVVGIPTETVYGLGADARNGSAVEKIFLAKGRPQDNPLICHISSMEMLSDVVSKIPEDALLLAKAFWPGPLTMVMPKGEKISPITCAGLDSVGVRMPSHPVALSLIEKCGFPLAAPSANISGKPSPTTALDVFEDMQGKIPMILDGGVCDKGVESTVLSLLGETPVLLRPGFVTVEDIQGVLGKEIQISQGIVNELSSSEPVRSPGLKYKHYSPNADIFILDGCLEDFANYVAKNSDQFTYALCFEGEEEKIPCKCLSYGKKEDNSTQAKKLFSALRELDKLGAKKVFARCPDKEGISLAVYNRLIRAAGFKIIKL